MSYPLLAERSGELSGSNNARNEARPKALQQQHPKGNAESGAEGRKKQAGLHPLQEFPVYSATTFAGTASLDDATEQQQRSFALMKKRSGYAAAGGVGSPQLNDPSPSLSSLGNNNSSASFSTAKQSSAVLKAVVDLRRDRELSQRENLEKEIGAIQRSIAFLEKQREEALLEEDEQEGQEQDNGHDDDDEDPDTSIPYAAWSPKSSPSPHRKGERDMYAARRRRLDEEEGRASSPFYRESKRSGTGNTDGNRFGAADSGSTTKAMSSNDNRNSRGHDPWSPSPSPKRSRMYKGRAIPAVVPLQQQMPIPVPSKEERRRREEHNLSQFFRSYEDRNDEFNYQSAASKRRWTGEVKPLFEPSEPMMAFLQADRSYEEERQNISDRPQQQAYCVSRKAKTGGQSSKGGERHLVKSSQEESHFEQFDAEGPTFTDLVPAVSANRQDTAAAGQATDTGSSSAMQREVTKEKTVPQRIQHQSPSRLQDKNIIEREGKDRLRSSSGSATWNETCNGSIARIASRLQTLELELNGYSDPFCSSVLQPAPAGVSSSLDRGLINGGNDTEEAEAIDERVPVGGGEREGEEPMRRFVLQTEKNPFQTVAPISAHTNADGSTATTDWALLESRMNTVWEGRPDLRLQGE